jgi:hypothetical protein
MEILNSAQNSENFSVIFGLIALSPGFKINLTGLKISFTEQC